jgi:hypothetical protein
MAGNVHMYDGVWHGETLLMRTAWLTPSLESKTTPVVHPWLCTCHQVRNTSPQPLRHGALLSPGRDPRIFVISTLKQNMRVFVKGKPLRG